jgi:hypothetical protein
MHKIQSTYLYGSFASVQVPVYGFSIPGAKANRSETLGPLVRSHDPKNNFLLNFFDDNRNQHQHADRNTSI